MRSPLQSLIRVLAGDLLQLDRQLFLEPSGERGVVGPGSISWEVFGNPVALAVGGIAAVLLELGEPRVRAGVWEHSSFRRDPAERIRRTGLGALVTVSASARAADGAGCRASPGTSPAASAASSGRQG